MSKLSSKELKEAYQDSHPGFSSYIDCISRALLTGFASFALGGSVSYIGQTLLRNRIPTNNNTRILVSAVIGLTISYRLTTVKAKECQDIARELEKNKPQA